MLIHSIILFTICLIVAGTARALDGAGKVSSNIILPPVAIFCAAVSFGLSWLTAIVAIASAATLIAGRTDWFNRKYMLVRYSLAPLVASLIAIGYFATPLAILVWPIMSAAVGFWYGDMKNFAQAKGIHEQVPEAIAGMIIIGLTSIGLFF